MAFLDIPVYTPLRTISRSFHLGVTLKGGGVRGHQYLILFIFTTLSFLSVPGNGARHRCYVCLPDDKTSSTARDILVQFPGQTIPDCSNFPNVTDDAAEIAHEFQFDCPGDYSGCVLRSSGSQNSRTCTPRHFQRCYRVNGIELCYCAQSLCNRDASTAKIQPSQLPPEREPIRTSRYFQEGVTDDEDLFPSFGGPRPSHHRQSSTQLQGHDRSSLTDEEEGSGQLDDNESEEYDEEEEEPIKEETTGGRNTSNSTNSNEATVRHIPTITIPTQSNDTHHHHGKNDNEPRNASHNNDPTISHHDNDNDPAHPHEIDNGYEDADSTNDNANSSSEERDAPTILQNGADKFRASLSNIILLLISSLAYLVTSRKS